MLKRGAQGPQGSKEDEGVFGMASTPDDKPHRATAAQLANRKIKDVRRRRAATPTTGGAASDATSFNPFASVAPAAAPAPTQSTGFTFGQTQSQSFPGASSGPSQGGMFSSGTNGQAGGQVSFSFGAGPTSFGSAPPSNPFSVETSFGGNTQSSTNGFSFGGFNTGNQSTPSFGGFGAQQNTSTPAKPALFGQSAAHMTSPADDSMQTSPDTKPKGASIFSTKPAAGPPALGNPFSNLSGQGAASNPFAPKITAPEKAVEKPAETQPFTPLFGSTPAASKPSDGDKPQPTVSNPFAPKVTAPEKAVEKPAETQPFKPLFGSTPAVSKPSDGDKPQPTASNPFANPPGQAPTSSTNLFAPKTTPAEQTPAKPAEPAKPFGALFGSTPSSQPSVPVSNIFAPKPTEEEPKASNPFANLSAPSSFGTLSSPKVTGTESAGKVADAQPFKPMFGTPAASKVSEAGKDQTPAPTFGNMFSPKPAAENAAAKPVADQPFKSMFGTPAVSKVSEAEKEQTPSSAFGNMFSPKPVAESTGAKPVEDKPFKPMFGTPVAGKEQSAANNVFAPKVTSEEQTPAPAKTPQFGSMFGASPAPSKIGEGKTAQPTLSNPFANLSGQNAFSSPFAPKPTEQAAKPQAPSTSLFGAGTAVDNNKLNMDNEVNRDNNIALNNSLSHPFTPGPKVSNEPQTEGATKTATPHVSFASTRDDKSSSYLPVPSSSSSLPSSSTTSTVSNTFTASDPDSLFPRTGHPVSIDYPEPPLDFDSMPLKRLFNEPNRDQLRARANLLMKIGVLTESFKREVAKCNPMTDDIDEVLILYAELRRELGVPIGTINPEEEAKRAALRKRDAAKEAAGGISPPRDAAKEAPAGASPRGAAKEVPNGVATPRIPTPPSFAPPGADDTRPGPSNKPSGGSTTSSKFAQSFSAPAPAPVTTSGGSPSTSTAGPAAAPVSVAPVEPSPPAAAPAFEIPKFGSGATGADFAAQFKSASDKAIAEAKAKRKAEEFDSDEEDEAEWERKDEERQREKRAQIEAAANKRPIFVPGVGFKFADDNPAPQNVEEPATSTAPAASATPSQLDSADTVNPTPDLFPAFSTPSAPEGANGASSVFSSASSKPVPASQNIFGGLKPSSPKRKAGDESDSDEDSPAKKTKSSHSIFGGPVPTSQNIFGGKPPSPKRKAGDESDNDEDSPAKKTKSSHSLFGGPVPTSQNIFGGKPSAPLPAASTDSSAQPLMATPSAPSTQPASTTTEEEDIEAGEIFDLTKGNGGEEEETVLFEDKSKVFKLESAWLPKGTGPVRVLKHPVTGRARVVARAEPSGNVTLNTLLKKEFDYKLTSNSVQFLVPNETGGLTHWAVRVKKERLQEFYQLVNHIKN
ncbi:hypothetical protein E8E15_006974 [Penicillium rubens]|uniref:Pc22g01390 protein n=2 Tax=Penicillium chrysogenum species complex TaxID=254878 RepID=B6HP37_PENRW|nr:uncharacterized protein N7525_006053 [Penicillium rubens]KZN86142.1 Nucleoporin [Penicillium chrysogenum]CAP97427.1 Pc22g01390 [Penicillium rubens Wisconsin 54-1255]KAF3029755.1 hypothetical protein E8E15_006974 [Penicillium rubens]KAJ5043333.1 hypothetical protein NUH16_000122 [Penicillium rubens]KAJ5840865.1 hypothetical protein N7525_006053 [Penicillium rubens]